MGDGGSSEREGNLSVLFWASLSLPFLGGWLLLYISSLQAFETVQAGMGGFGEAPNFVLGPPVWVDTKLLSERSSGEFGGWRQKY